LKYLLDTHLLIWISDKDLNHLVPTEVTEIIADNANDVLFSVASLWEIVIKSGLGREDFQIDAEKLRLGALASGFEELPILAPHTFALAELPLIHKDPFDRLLIAQAKTESAELLTHDETVNEYGTPVRLV